MRIEGIIWLRAVLFIYKQTNEALVLSARDMEAKERRRYGKK